MANRGLDHNHIVFGLRRQIKGAERKYNDLKKEPLHLSTEREVWSVLVRRRALLMILLAYQLATFDFHKD